MRDRNPDELAGMKFIADMPRSLYPIMPA
jgi:hypothetical protein